MGQTTESLPRGVAGFGDELVKKLRPLNASLADYVESLESSEAERLGSQAPARPHPPDQPAAPRTPLMSLDDDSGDT